MEETQLRIGNKLQIGSNIITVQEIGFGLISTPEEGEISLGHPQVSGIPITEDWLKRFGCKNLGPDWWETPNGIQFNFHQENNCGLITFGSRHVNFWHVHTFQNIIALTGTELVIE